MQVNNAVNLVLTQETRQGFRGDKIDALLDDSFIGRTLISKVAAMYFYLNVIEDIIAEFAAQLEPRCEDGAEEL